MAAARLQEPSDVKNWAYETIKGAMFGLEL
jgi:hypothetical protein